MMYDILNIDYETIKIPKKIKKEWNGYLNIISNFLNIPYVFFLKLKKNNILIYQINQIGKNHFKPGQKIKLSESIYEKIISDKEKLIINNLKDSNGWKIDPLLKSDMKSFFGIPILWSGGSVFGMLMLFDNKKNIFSKDAVSIIGTFKKIIETNLDLLIKEERIKIIQERERKYRMYVENSYDSIMKFNKKHQHLYVNPIVEKQTGIPYEKFIGKTHDDLGFPKKLCELWEKAINKVFDTGDSNRIEFQLPSGMWIDWLLIPEFDNNNKVQNVFTYARDITDRKKTEDELKNKDLLLYNLINNMPIVCFRYDKDGRILSWNKGAETVYGYTQNEAIGRTAYELIVTPMTESDTKKVIKSVFEGKIFKEMEWQDHDKEGKIGWRMGNTFPIYNKDGDIECGVNLTIDITKKVKYEEKLKQREHTFRIIFEGSIDGIVYVNTKGEFIDCNQSFLNMLGYTMEELKKKKNFYDITPEKWHEWEQKEIINGQLKLKGFSDTYEKEYIRKDGSIFPIEVTAYKMEDKYNNEVVYWAVVRDITERKSLEAEKLIKEKMLLRAERLASLGTLASAIAHEIRQPLQLIKVISETILLRFSKKNELSDFNEKNKKNLIEISNGVIRINDIIENMQRLVETSRKNIEHNININEVINNTIYLYKQKIKNHGIFLETLLDENINNIFCSEVLIQQIIGNILNNAIDALDTVLNDEKIIKITTKKYDKKIILEISDNGPGINPEDKEKIFDPMFTTKINNESMGMGLYIVHNIIQSINGQIETFNNDNGGAVFRIII